MNRTLWSLFVIACLAVNTTNAQKGIEFLPAKISDVFAKAKQTGKPVFIEIYSPTCHVCQSFMPTLDDPRVGAFYNREFVNTRLDVGSKATQAWLVSQKLFIPSLPLFLYYDSNQVLMHFAMSTNSVEEVIRHGTTALTPLTRSQHMKARYAAGERTAGFLIDYGTFARVTRDTTISINVMNEYARQQPITAYASETNWLVIKKLLMDMDNPIFQYLVNHLFAYKQYDQEQVKSVAENILMSSLYSTRGALYNSAKVLQVKQQLVLIGIDPKKAGSWTLLPEVNAYLKQKQTAKAAARMNEHVTAMPFSIPEYIYISRLFNSNSPDVLDVVSVLSWVHKALAIKSVTINEQADLYFEEADAYRRVGKRAEANTSAQKSMELAKLAKLDTSRNMAQLAKLK
ncbi:MAG: DUF255 domain-containing protein [Cytophagaceae bacterium]|nr:MAG: DUF255 domain-containing protein [Cytophagaceae bacterium]